MERAHTSTLVWKLRLISLRAKKRFQKRLISSSFGKKIPNFPSLGISPKQREISRGEPSKKLLWKLLTRGFSRVYPTCNRYFLQFFRINKNPLYISFAQLPFSFTKQYPPGYPISQLSERIQSFNFPDIFLLRVQLAGIVTRCVKSEG